MKHRYGKPLVAGLLAALLSVAASAQEPSAGVALWNFDVYLNEKKVGTHVFKVSETGGLTFVSSEASFMYKILFIPAYRYEHRAVERWSDNCLVEFDANTNANGKYIHVSGEQAGAAFLVERDDAPVALPECVMTFAYWNPEFLRQPRLLNPQTGDYVDVSVEKQGAEVLQINGEAVPATRFRLTAGEVDLTLWYSHDDQWLALQSVAKGGHIIRYELS